MGPIEMLSRTKQFAIDCAYLTISLPLSDINKAYRNQLIRSSSGAAANYRATRRAKSTADFINKLKITEEELDESLFFLEMIAEFNKNKREIIVPIYRSGEELLKIVVASIKTSRTK